MTSQTFCLHCGTALTSGKCPCCKIGIKTRKPQPDLYDEIKDRFKTLRSELQDLDVNHNSKVDIQEMTSNHPLLWLMSFIILFATLVYTYEDIAKTIIIQEHPTDAQLLIGLGFVFLTFGILILLWVIYRKWRQHHE